MTIKWRWWRFRFELDTFGEWRWRQPLGWGPRWLRRIWCLTFHWRRFEEIADTNHRTYGPETEVYEHIRVIGCYQCQLPWGRRYRYSPHPEDP